MDAPSDPALRLVHLEDNPVDHGLVVRALRRAELEAEVQLVDTLEGFREALTGPARVDAVLADYHLAGFSGLEAWTWMRAQGLDLPFILVSGAIGEATVADAMVRGVSDYVDKQHLGRLPHVLQRALELHATRRREAEAARALAQSRQSLLELTEHLQTSIDRERADIAREIHDDIGGALAAVKLDLAWLQRRLADAEALAHVASALTMTEQALGASQRIMRNLRPAVLDQGLMAALQWLTRTFAERTGLEVTLHGALRTATALPARVEMAAYRTVQEALTNVLKHAQARRVRVEVSDLEDHLTIEVADDGRGAAPEELRKERSFGLLGLRERAQSVGGWLDVVTAPGQGMTLILSIPLSEAARQQTAVEED
ncbi:Signal transduction histidine-protein kinase/phosphatase DegS [Tepidimonas sediminis]|uniref:histidine kinase n=1 Tax=Tepidimonas sediminis TaxID=2588941 RepID=A0A554WNQ6_9BURK|nr:ATP-binding protein [Tepidimonas sediminis]TSE25206.1 Signal transduction histidine-protein kinase/phosphatase DegS [Tepidimonas sediminis]